ncbi:MAG: uracil-DNA glycosylase [Candidatus Jorgensenbacteria bacterium]|nr:uracil-DNA glycosylase [Candidatus Jorgensenbacteria bacterium]
MEKQAALLDLEKRIVEDKNLPLREGNLVFGEGNINCDVMFIGEAPGFHEDQLKRPFVGRAGQLLDKLIIMVGWKREDVYITNIVKRRPPENRDPLPEEIEAYKPYLKEQIRIINPKIIAPLGRFSMNYFLPDAKISRDQGKVFRIKDKLIVPLFHPAAALRGTGTLEALKGSFKKLPAIIKRYDALVAAPHIHEEPHKELSKEQNKELEQEQERLL